MNRMNRKIKITSIASAATLIIAGGAVTYGFQGILAALGLLFLLTSGGIGIHVLKKARLYAKALKHAEWVNNMELAPVSTSDKKWIMKNIDEYFRVKKKIRAPEETVITKKDKNIILSQLDEFMTEKGTEYDTITPEDQEFILENVELLFDNNRGEGRQSFTW